MKWLRRWSRILHRDIGYFFIGTSLIYGISGIALNHINDWNPSYSVNTNRFTTSIDLQKNASKQNVEELIAKFGDGIAYKSHYYPEPTLLKVFLKGGSTILVNTTTGEGMAEFLKRRPLFYEVNYLHYNPNEWWMWFSDIFAGALIFLAITSFFIVKGWKGAWGRGGIYIVLGFVIPIIFLFVFA